MASSEQGNVSHKEARKRGMKGDVGEHGIEQRAIPEEWRTKEQATGGRLDRQGNGDIVARVSQKYVWEMLG